MPRAPVSDDENSEAHQRAVHADGSLKDGMGLRSQGQRATTSIIDCLLSSAYLMLGYAFQCDAAPVWIAACTIRIMVQPQSKDHIGLTGDDLSPLSPGGCLAVPR